ncbi:MAG: transcriptional repressor [Desulfovibrio sp.]|nr:MAG: transcriptional repressor [Desulfovibrio sp.]
MKDPKSVFSEYIERNNLKMTPQRHLILDVFLKTEEHMASEELYDVVREHDPAVGQATVYRTLKLLSDAGIAREVHFGDGVTRYEPSQSDQHHDHLICESCGTNIEVLDERIEKLQEELATKHDYVLTGHSMYLYGLCPKCRKGS